MQVVSAEQVRSDVSEWGADTYSPDVHTRRASHPRSEVLVGFELWYCVSALHSDIAVQLRSDVAVAATNSYSLDVHAVTGEQKRSDVAVAVTDS